MDLRDGNSLWLNNEPAGKKQEFDSENSLSGTKLTLNHEVDVAIIGAGVSGALVADELLNAGIIPVIFEGSKQSAMGSTAASTAIGTHELDSHLCELIDLYGQEQAEQLYRGCFDAMNNLAARLSVLGPETALRFGPSLYIAQNEEDAQALSRECEARYRAGVLTELISEWQLKECFNLDGLSALWSERIFCIDPVKTTQALLRKSTERGTKIFTRANLVKVEQRDDKVHLLFDNNIQVRANQVILANGYEMTKILPATGVKLVSSYVLASEPIQSSFPWQNPNLVIWETARPYLYIRPANGGRVIVGGGDCSVKSPLLRKLAAPFAFHQLKSRFKKYWGDAVPSFTHHWLGIFAESEDGLPIIGPDPKRDRVFYILNSGGNGLVFAELAAKLVAAWLYDKHAALPEALRVQKSKPQIKLKAQSRI